MALPLGPGTPWVSGFLLLSRQRSLLDLQPSNCTAEAQAQALSGFPNPGFSRSSTQTHRVYDGVYDVSKVHQTQQASKSKLMSS